MPLKWPSSIDFVRHAPSAYNEMAARKKQDPLFQKFVEAYERDSSSTACISLAKEIAKAWSLGYSDRQTPLSDTGRDIAVKTGQALHRQRNDQLPHVVIVSPYQRTQETLAALIEGWPELAASETIEDDRIRELEHGLLLAYNDRRVMMTLHPEQRILYDIEGEYAYRYPQGENIADVRERCRNFTRMLIREFAGQRVLVVTHHLTILAIRANLERLGVDEFLRLDREEKPINCGVTSYRGIPNVGRHGHGKLELVAYNQKLY
jgi:broad specificity phosphatase PhoE